MHKIFVTGGHFTPAKAVVDLLVKKYHVFYIGRKHALEGDSALSLEYQEMANRSDLNFLEITAGRVQRRFTNKTLPSLLKIPIGFIQSCYWLIKYKPAAVMSFGGYVSIPISTMAKLFGIPVVNHEQIPALGLPSRFLNKISTKVLVSFPHLVRSREIYTGNPVRAEIFQGTMKLSLPKPKTIYITGGNQGSHKINAVIFNLLDELLKTYNLIWQTGDSQEYKDFDKVSYRTENNLLVRKFFSSSEIGSVFEKADLIIGRSGANTVTEVAALAKPAIFVPIPWSHDNEQLKNAQELEKFGAAKILSESDLTPENLLRVISEVFANLSEFEKNAQAAQKSLLKDPASLIVKELESVLHG